MKIVVTAQYLENIKNFHIGEGNKVVPYADPTKGVYIKLANRPLYKEFVVGQPVPNEWKRI